MNAVLLILKLWESPFFGAAAAAGGGTKINPIMMILLLLVITGITVFLATREKDELMDQDDKIPRGKTKPIDTDGPVIEITSAKSAEKLRKMMDYKGIKKADTEKRSIAD